VSIGERADESVSDKYRPAAEPQYAMQTVLQVVGSLAKVGSNLNGSNRPASSSRGTSSASGTAGMRAGSSGPERDYGQDDEGPEEEAR
jgi:hypothetical protein